VVLLGLWLLLAHTRWGILVRAATEDRDMVAVLGEDQARLFTGVFVLGSWLAGVGGTLAAPLVALTPGMDTTMIVEAFVVVVIGGMGNVAGSLLAALLIGELQAFGVLILPRLTLILVFVVMAVVLVVRPWGLAGRPLPPVPVAPGAAAPAPGRGRLVGLGWGLVSVGLLLVPALVGPFGLVVATEMLAFAVCACSLNVLLGYGGMLSFGHAAYMGLGAYGAALLLTRAQFPGPLAGALGPLVAAGGALVFGVFCVRLRGIYFAMLTLACAQVAYTVVFQWYSVTGGDNGILGVWPASWLATPMAYYYCTLGVTAAAVWSLRTILGSPFGLTLRAIRDNPRRAMTLGLHVPVQQLTAFVLAGFFAGVAGVVLVFQKGSVFPEALSVVQSLDVLVMVLLGGMQSFAGPLLGAGLYKLLDTVVTAHVAYWSAVLGVILGPWCCSLPKACWGS
jgi:branched-chain amino acid transport system permease protein